MSKHFIIQHKMKKLISRNLYLFLLMLLIATILGCSFVSEKDEAEELMLDYFKCIKTNDLTNIDNFYASRNQIQDKLRLPRTLDYGDLHTYILNGWKTTHRTLISNGKETKSVSVELRYWVIYTSGITDEWYLLGKQDSDDRFLIRDIKINKRIVISALYNSINQLIRCFR